jgi:shikimate kinase
VFLIGFMATGKSTVGALLAQRLGTRFVDLDGRIEQDAGATVVELFASEGEAAFRAREQKALAEVIAEGAQVVAVGGGAPVFGDNLERMLGAGVVIWLTAPLDVLLARIGDARTRPLLASVADRRAEIERLLVERGPFYARAHHVVDGAPAPSQVVAAILEKLGW